MVIDDYSTSFNNDPENLDYRRIWTVLELLAVDIKSGFRDRNHGSSMLPMVIFHHE